MTRFTRHSMIVAAALAAALTLSSSASAGLVETYLQMELEEPFQQFGFGLSIIAQPGIQGEVLESHVDVVFTTDSGFDAALFSLLIIAPTDDGAGGFNNIWSIEGADLGWAGEGTFTASISSNILSGMIFPDPDFAIWEVFLGPNFGTLEELTVAHDYIVPAPAGMACLLLGAACRRRRRRP